MPLYYDALGVDVQFLGLVVDTPAGAAVCVPLGLLVGLASLHVTSAVARLSGRVAGAFLDGGA